MAHRWRTIASGGRNVVAWLGSGPANASETIERAFGALPPDWRMIVLLADVAELSYREIAGVMGVPIGTVMSRLHRARKRLQDELLRSPQPSVARSERTHESPDRLGDARCVPRRGAGRERPLERQHPSRRVRHLPQARGAGGAAAGRGARPPGGRRAARGAKRPLERRAGRRRTLRDARPHPGARRSCCVWWRWQRRRWRRSGS